MAEKETITLIARNCSYVPFSLLDPGNHRSRAIIQQWPHLGSLSRVLTAPFCPFSLISSLAFSPSTRAFLLSRQSSLSYLPLIPLSTGSIPSFRPPFPLPRFPSHLNDRLCQSKLKPAFVYLIPRYKYRQTGYRWLLGAATSCVFEGRRWRKRDKNEECWRTERERERKEERKGTWKRAPFCRSRRGRRRFSVRKTV